MDIGSDCYTLEFTNGGVLMSIKTTFRSFTATTFLIEQISREAIRDRLNNSGSQTISIDIDTSKAAIAVTAQPAFIAFSIELGLKTVLVNSGASENPRGHNLEKLFTNLPRHAKNTISNDVKEKLNIDDTQFEELLLSNANSFEKWRYFHESNSLSCNKEFLGQLLTAIHNYTVNENY